MPGSQEAQAFCRNYGKKSPQETYRLNGEELRSKPEMYVDSELLHLFKEDPQATRAVRGEGRAEGVRPQAEAHNPSQNWNDINGYHIQSSNSFSSNPYLGGPNITPPFTMTGELAEAKRRHQDSSSSSESESSQGSHHRTESHSRSGGIRLNKDEKLARENGIQLSIKDIVDPPMDEFNDMLSKEDLSEEQLNICRDIRRRGKNKVAAQNCRKRKLEQIDELQKKVEEARQRRQLLRSEHEQLRNVYVSEAETLKRLQDTVLSHHGKNPNYYTVVVKGEQVDILPTNSVPESDRFPKPVDHFRIRLTASEEQYHTNSHMYGQLPHHQHQAYLDRGWD